MAQGVGSRISESRTGRHPSQIGLRVDLRAQTTRLACILISSLSRTNDLRVKRSQLHDSSNGSGALFGHSTHRSEKSWQRELAGGMRINVVLAVLAASWRNRRPERGRGMRRMRR